MSVREREHPDLYRMIQERNLLRQYDLLVNCIEIGLEKGIEAFDKYMLWELNHVAVANIAQQGGRFRKEPIFVGNHIPPHHKDVPELMDARSFSGNPTGTSPGFIWNNCYYLICMKARRLP